MEKYAPKTKSELRKLLANPEINLGDIDTSAITDMSNLFGSDFEDDLEFFRLDFCQANKFIPRENDKNYPALVS